MSNNSVLWDSRNVHVTRTLVVMKNARARERGSYPVDSIGGVVVRSPNRFPVFLGILVMRAGGFAGTAIIALVGIVVAIVGLLRRHSLRISTFGGEHEVLSSRRGLKGVRDAIERAVELRG